jgi:hypothetical protein
MKKSKLISIVLSAVFFFCICFLVSAQEEKQPEKFTDNLLFEFGGVFGTPAFLNAVAGCWFDQYGVRISGMYLGSIYGIQLNIGYQLSQKKNIRHLIGIAAAKSKEPGSEFYFAGPFYNLNVRNFFLETGVNWVFHIEKGDFDRVPIWIFLQIGYVHLLELK